MDQIKLEVENRIAYYSLENRRENCIDFLTFSKGIKTNIYFKNDLRNSASHLNIDLNVFYHSTTQVSHYQHEHLA